MSTSTGDASVVIGTTTATTRVAATTGWFIVWIAGSSTAESTNDLLLWPLRTNNANTWWKEMLMKEAGGCSLASVRLASLSSEKTNAPPKRDLGASRWCLALLGCL